MSVHAACFSKECFSYSFKRAMASDGETGFEESGVYLDR
jgi:hypothetical protein